MVRISLAPGWKTYWRAPGDAGIPPQFQWDGSQNVATAQFHWPTPGVMNQNGLRSIGYDKDVVIPVELTVPDAGAPARLRGGVLIGVCQDICVPMSFDFDAILPVSGARDRAILAALADRPKTQAEAGIGTVSLTRDGGMIVSQADMIHMDGGAFALDRSEVRITLLSQGSAVDIRGCVARG